MQMRYPTFGQHECDSKENIIVRHGEELFLHEFPRQDLNSRKLTVVTPAIEHMLESVVWSPKIPI